MKVGVGRKEEKVKVEDIEIGECYNHYGSNDDNLYMRISLRNPQYAECVDCVELKTGMILHTAYDVIVYAIDAKVVLE